MKKTQVLLALAGLFALTGCGEKVMDHRVYVPAKDEKAIGASRQYDDFASDKTFGEIPAASNLPDNQSAPGAPAATAPAPAPAPAAPARSYRYAPMENVKSSGGITSSGKRSRKASRRAGAKKVSGKAGEYVVKAGDFPARIARRFGVSVSALLEANKMTMQDAKKLQIGQKLIIPGNSGKAVKGKKAGKTAAKSAVKAEAGIYIVRSGDFPQRIARRLKVKLADLLKANNLTIESSRKLQVGQKLIIPGAKTAAVPPQATVVEAESTPEKKVAAPNNNGALNAADNMAEKLEETSPESDAGNNTEVPVDDNATVPYELQEDTTFKALAVKFNTTEEHLRRINVEMTGDTLIKGKCILVPAQK